MHQIRKVIKIMKFEKIRKQIETGEIKFFGSNEILDEYDNNNMNHLTYAIISHYLETKTKNSSYITSTDIFFETNMSLLKIDKLINENKEPHAVYFELQSSNSPIARVFQLEIPKYKKGNYEEYFEHVIKNIRRQIENRIEEFDPEEYFDDMYEPYEGMSPREVLSKLDKTKDDFFDFLEELD